MPTPEGFCTDSSRSGSPSGSTQPGSTGTVIVPPRATSGAGQGTRHASTPHHCGAASPVETVRVTEAGADRSPLSAVPSVTAYEKVAEPDAPGATATVRRCESSVIETVPKRGSRPVTDAGSMLSTSSFGSWSFMSTGRVARLAARTPNASGTATGGSGSRTTLSCSSLCAASGFVRSSSDQFWLEGTRAPSGTVHTQPVRVSFRMTASSLATNVGRRWSGSVPPP